MSGRNGVALINAKLDEGKNICVGLDTELQRIPPCFWENTEPGYEKVGIGSRTFRFNRAIIEATHDLVGAYKFNLKFYLAEMYQGLYALEQSIAFVKKIAPDVPVILDSKDGDVGVSMRKAAEFAFEKLGVDAITVNPWGGYEDGLDAFFEYKDKMIFVWCCSSNNGAGNFQRLLIMPDDGAFSEPLPTYQYIAYCAVNEWSANDNCGLVVGATYLEELGCVREEIDEAGGNIPILVPGIGAQGGDLEAAVKVAGSRTLFNSSRGIIYASKGIDFAEAARAEVMRLQNEIDKHRK